MFGVPHNHAQFPKDRRKARSQLNMTNPVIPSWDNRSRDLGHGLSHSCFTGVRGRTPEGRTPKDTPIQPKYTFNLQNHVFVGYL